MANRHFDFIVIGGGSAGYAAARTAREVCERVAIVDDAAELGGLCILRGCMPSKTLIYSAELLHQAQRGALFGLNIPSATVDMPALRARKVRMIDDFKGYRQEQLQSDRFTLLRARARFVDARTIELQPGGERLSADRFVVATGSTAALPDIPGLRATPGIWTSDAVLDLDQAPASVLVLGGGVVACELAQYLHRIGVRVIQIQRSPRLLREFSAEAAEVVATVFRAEGIELHTGTKIEQIGGGPGAYTARFRAAGKVHEVTAGALFNALGRSPNSAGLGLEQAGVEINGAGQIVVDQWQRSSNPRVYAAGDVSGPYEIVHLAIMQGEVAARHGTDRKTDPVNYMTRTGVVFTDPQVATAGISLDEARTRGLPVRAARYPFADHGKAILMEARDGYVAAWVNTATGRLLGAECVGRDAGELIHAMAVAISLRATAQDLLRVHWYHPTLSEIWTYPLEELAVGCGL